MKCLLRKHEMPLGTGGFVSFHVRPKGVHFKIAQQSFHVRSTFHGKRKEERTLMSVPLFAVVFSLDQGQS